MFSDRSAADGESAAFPSSWRKTMSKKSSDTQTEPMEAREAETQAGYAQGIETQTETPQAESNEAAAEAAEKQMNNPSLVKFLVRATPMIESELESASRSRAFDGYSLIEDEEDTTVRKLHMLDAGSGAGANEAARNRADVSDEDLRVSAVTWSASGSVVGVAYEWAAGHEEWCDHQTTFNIWNLSRRDFDPGVPYHQFFASSCLTKARFHPKDPSYVATGGFTGEVALWSVFKERGDHLVASSAIQQTQHREKITGLEWLTSNHAGGGTDATAPLKSSQILTTALDSKMILWTINTNEGTLEAKRIFLFLAEHLPKELKVRYRSSQKTEVGITCLSVNKEDQSIALVGTEAGVVFQCSLESELPVAPPDDADDASHDNWFDPVSVVFAPHRGRVLDVQCSPFHRDIFLSVGSDQELRIFSLLEPREPVHRLHRDGSDNAGGSGLSAVSWSPHRPMVLATATQNNAMHIFDLRFDKTGSRMELRASEKLIPVPMTSVDFNRRDLLAAGDALGRVHVWKLNSDLSSTGTSEIMLLEAFLTANAEE